MVGLKRQHLPNISFGWCDSLNVISKDANMIPCNQRVKEGLSKTACYNPTKPKVLQKWLKERNIQIFFLIKIIFGV